MRYRKRGESCNPQRSGRKSVDCSAPIRSVRGAGVLLGGVYLLFRGEYNPSDKRREHFWASARGTIAAAHYAGGGYEDGGEAAMKTQVAVLVLLLAANRSRSKFPVIIVAAAGLIKRSPDIKCDALSSWQPLMPPAAPRNQENSLAGSKSPVFSVGLGYFL